MSVDLLDREMFTEAEAARLLKVSQSTLHWWLEGGTYRGRTYAPVVRADPRGDRVVNWAEFVEAGLLRMYRRERGVELAELRVVIDRLRTAFGVPYPLAHFRPFTSGRRLVWEVQQELGLDGDLCLVAVANDQIVLTGSADSYVQRVQWGQEVAEGWRPDANPGSPVRILPDVRFGRPSVGGVSTEALWDQAEGGAGSEEIARDFGLEVSDVRWALAYESGARARARARARAA